MRVVWRCALLGLAALACTLLSLNIRPTTDEIAQYGNVGPPEENYQLRVVAGWPAPFVADRAGISVPRAPGPEDTFRGGAFLASFSFWLWVVTGAWWALRRILHRRPGT